ncbi:MAG TPA: SIS domain-containing protein [Spirochaetia bacterium]|nr:SIS domain-containing protein [Spirochaetia bacterium]
MDFRESILQETLAVHPRLTGCRREIDAAATIVCECYAAKGKLLACGNGGSAADAEHIVGELMKAFRMKRPLPEDLRSALVRTDAAMGPLLAERLQGALPAIALTGHASLTTAFSNDVDPLLVFAQQLYGYGVAGDVLVALSTSGNSKNVLFAVVAARCLGIRTIAMTGSPGGRLADLCDVAIRVPESETALVQELHLPVYHAICSIVEQEFFGTEGRGYTSSAPTM